VHQQKAESRKQKAESRKQKAESRKIFQAGKTESRGVERKSSKGIFSGAGK